MPDLQETTEPVSAIPQDNGRDKVIKLPGLSGTKPLDVSSTSPLIDSPVEPVRTQEPTQPQIKKVGQAENIGRRRFLKILGVGAAGTTIALSGWGLTRLIGGIAERFHHSEGTKDQQDAKLLWDTVHNPATKEQYEKNHTFFRNVVPKDNPGYFTLRDIPYTEEYSPDVKQIGQVDKNNGPIEESIAYPKPRNGPRLRGDRSFLKEDADFSASTGDPNGVWAIFPVEKTPDGKFRVKQGPVKAVDFVFYATKFSKSADDI